ncbi:hypothetical protein CDAR_432531 [Caerostris darwini]|uniref:Uncharacterized protein n=1 Tax=Caerostris darwini TaxID=1538125 RepID=A0AAV4U357_9ARAC|nr:hypothetical protein CDAR_432531 [Caerostris darwini]
MRPRSRKTDAMKWKHIPVTLSHSAGKIKRDNVGHWRLETPKPLALCVDLMPRSLFGILSLFLLVCASGKQPVNGRFFMESMEQELWRFQAVYQQQFRHFFFPEVNSTLFITKQF